MNNQIKLQKILSSLIVRFYDGRSLSIDYWVRKGSQFRQIDFHRVRRRICSNYRDSIIISIKIMNEIYCEDIKV